MQNSHERVAVGTINHRSNRRIELANTVDNVHAVESLRKRRTCPRTCLRNLPANGGSKPAKNRASAKFAKWIFIGWPGTGGKSSCFGHVQTVDTVCERAEEEKESLARRSGIDFRWRRAVDSRRRRINEPLGPAAANLFVRTEIKRWEKRGSKREKDRRKEEGSGLSIIDDVLETSPGLIRGCANYCLQLIFFAWNVSFNARG